MNELEIIRRQLALEQSHAAEVANACAAAFGSPGAAEVTPLFREACVSYLVWVLARFEERDQTLSESLGSRGLQAHGAVGTSERHLAGLISQAGTSRETLSRLEAALGAGESDGARAAWQEFARLFNSAWTPRRAALGRAIAEHLTVAEWRTISAIDADSILDERNRYARFLAERPAGIAPRPAPPGEIPPDAAASQRNSAGEA